jgi:hypothetical protein
MKVLTILTTATFASLAALHCYWAAGGQWGLATAIPTVGGRRAFNPSVVACLVVAALLAGAALLTYAATGAFKAVVPVWFARTGLAVVALVFLARSIGDFHLFGFAKTVHATDFAQMDTMLYSPLCVALSLVCGILALRGQQ